MNGKHSSFLLGGFNPKKLGGKRWGQVTRDIETWKCPRDGSETHPSGAFEFQKDGI